MWETSFHVDFPMYENIFSQFMESKWGYPYLSHSWILRDFSCVFDISPLKFCSSPSFSNYELRKIFLKIRLICRQSVISLKIRLRHRCFPVAFEKFLRLSIFKNIFERLLLYLLENIFLQIHKSTFIPFVLFLLFFSFF